MISIFLPIFLVLVGATSLLRSLVALPVDRVVSGFRVGMAGGTFFVGEVGLAGMTGLMGDGIIPSILLLLQKKTHLLIFVILQ